MKRYNLSVIEKESWPCGWVTDARMVEEKDGQWVRYEDVIAKLNELDERIKDISLFPDLEKSWYEG